MLCDKCQQREATCYVFSFTFPAGEAPATSNLCSECFEASSPASHTQKVVAALRACCCYCGGEPVNTGPDLSAALSGKHKTAGLCGPCSHEFYRLVALKLPGLQSGWIDQEQNTITVVYAEIHEHMKKWVAERGAH